MDKGYKVQKAGDGHSPHVLENVEDSTDKMFLCSCGGTSDSNGFCDGTHAKRRKTIVSVTFVNPKRKESKKK